MGLIFSNAIENGINACIQIKNISDRLITIVCKEHFDQLYIQISNPYVNQVIFDNDIPTSSESNHGLGTRSIVAITEKNNGIYSFFAEDGIFKLTVILK